MNIFNNLQIKILAILSALLLWAFVVGVENYVFTLPNEINVKVINLGQNVSVASELPRVKIRYKNHSDNANNINANEFEVFADAANLSEGTHLINVGFISKNPQINVVAVEPAQIQVNLEAIASKEITLKSDLSGRPGNEYEIKGVKLSQDKIKISGASSLLKKINFLTVKINLDGSERADFSRKIAPEAPAEWNLNGKTISFDPGVIQADIQIRKIERPSNNNQEEAVNKNNAEAANGLIKRTMMVPMVKTSEASTKEILPQNVLVTVQGEASVINSLVSGDIKLNLNLDQVQNGEYLLDEKQIMLPEGKEIQIVDFSPDKVLVKF